MATIDTTGTHESLRAALDALNTEVAAATTSTALQAVDDGSLTITIGAGKNLIVTSLPTSDPGVAGALWADSGVVTVSAG
jgi:hypothetical protein